MPGDEMMKLETTNARDWRGFSRILEVMTFLEEIADCSAGEVRQALEEFCELPPNPGQTMSLEEVVFWAGVASGMEFSRYAQEQADPGSEQKMLLFASLFAHSMKNAIVDLAIGELENRQDERFQLARRFRR
jgi:hypothetical protein